MPAKTVRELVALARTPQPVLDRLYAETVRIIGTPEVRERFAGQSGEVVASTPAAFGKFIAAEIANWKAVAQAGNIKAE
ncbi:MAG: hypothetical protein ACREUW_08980 [Burkholderiales bacterium]